MKNKLKNLDSNFISNTEINSKLIRGLNVSANTIKFLEKNK